MSNPISQLGHGSLQTVQRLGNMTAFGGALLRAAITPPIRIVPLIRELHKLGVMSLIIICVCGVSVGMVLGLQGYHTLVRFGAQGSLGALVGVSLIRELGPVMTALLLIGRAGSATTAELGTMVATEQLDGLRMLSIDPLHLIVTPKALAMLLVAPMLTAIFILCGLFGGFVVGVYLMGGDPGSYISSLTITIDFHNDIAGSLLKSIVFGTLLAWIATYRGYTSAPNSEGVSAATTSTVVIASVTVLLSDYIITALWGV